MQDQPLQSASEPKTATGAAASQPTVQDAERFVQQVDKELRSLLGELERAAWVKSTYINQDTEWLEARAQERYMAYITGRIQEAARFDGLDLPQPVRRQLDLLKFYADLPAPANAEKRAEFAKLISQLDGVYGRGTYCSEALRGHARPEHVPAKEDKGCRTLTELSEIIAHSRDYELLLEAWAGWRTIARPMRPMYARFVELGNEGARDLGFDNMADIWKGHYDMPAEAFTAEIDRLEEELRPLYTLLHCYVRKRLRAHYGPARIPEHGPIPAHVLGNMWAQEWSYLYDLVEPYPGKGPADVTKRLKAKRYEPLQLVRLAEGFFTSLGMKPLPETFWERSLFIKPRDREVICHASAWDVALSGDLRVKMCIQTDYENLVTIHHELGHNYYFMYYHDQPVLFQQGANDGFHEGIGDTLALAVTPDYLKQVGILDRVPASKEADINVLLARALDGVAFLPFGKMIDQWRWDVFSGEVPEGQYNAHWWALRERFQGIAAPVERTEADFDPGAKYHIPGNTPYIRYYLARVLQYQFLRALCRAAGHDGPLHHCSFYGSEAAGEKLKAMMALGASQPWPQALQALSGETRMDASALLEYYEPLTDFLEAQTQDQQCGW